MINFNIRFRSFDSTPKPLLTFIRTLSFYSRSTLLPYKGQPTNWNTTHTLVLSNPLLSLLEKCKSITQLKQVQTQMIITGLISDGLAASRLLAFCAISESRNLEYCRTLLNNLQNPDVFSWNVTIRGYCESEKPRESLLLYKQMLGRSKESRPDNYTYPSVLKACARLSLIWLGNGIIGHVVHLGFSSDMFVNNAVIHLLVSCGELDDAHKMFAESCVRNLVSWNSIINGYVKRGKAIEALRLYQEMEREGIKPDEVTMIGVISSCGQLGDLNLGREFHQYVKENRINMTVQLTNALMDMYVKCGSIEGAKDLFDKMDKKTIVSWTTMVVGYAKFGRMDAAKKLFDKMPEKDVIPWNALIGCYVQAKRSKDALDVFHEMLAANIKPDEVTMVHCLSACTQLGALDHGIWFHHYVEKQKLSLNVALGTALVDMYAKCGNIAKALQVFSELPGRNSLTWTAVISGLANHGNGHAAISHFWQMIHVGLMPDEVTFLAVLSACCHVGLVEEGRKIFSQMTHKFSVCPKPKHYSCMVDLLGRAGLLEEAEELIKSMPIEADAKVWGALFFACRVHGNLEMGVRTALKLLELDPHDSGNYVLLASMYWEAKMYEKSRQVRKMMRDKRVDKTPGCSSIEVNGNLYEFIIRDKSHPESEQINECLVQLTKQLKLFEDLSGNYRLGNSFVSGYEVAA